MMKELAGAPDFVVIRASAKESPRSLARRLPAGRVLFDEVLASIRRSKLPLADAPRSAPKQRYRHHHLYPRERSGRAEGGVVLPELGNLNHLLSATNGTPSIKLMGFATHEPARVFHYPAVSILRHPRYCCCSCLRARGKSVFNPLFGLEFLNSLADESTLGFYPPTNYFSPPE